MYAIVEFVADRTCDKAPKTWLISETECLWPPSSTKGEDVTTLIRNMATPKQDWVAYKIRKLGVAATYGEACVKAKKAEEESDLSTSDVENYGRGQRGKKRGRSQVIVESDDDDDDIQYEKTRNILRNLPIPPEPQNDFSRAHCSRDSNFQLPHSQERSHSVGGSGFDDVSSMSSQSSAAFNFLQPQIVKEAARARSCSTMPPQESTPVASKSNSVLKSVCRDLTIIKHNQGKILDLLGLILERESNALSRPMPSEPKLTQVFPLKTEEELNNLEASVADASCENELLTKWKTFGGSSCGDHTRRILKDLMTDALAETYSWLGHKDKKRFSSLKLSQIIIDAVVQMNNKITRAEVEKVLKDWLRHAKERRDYKTKKTQPQNTVPQSEK